MKLAQLLSVYPQLRWGDNSGADVVGITNDSRQVQPGWLFVAVRGNSSDGHRYIREVINSGAIGLIVEDMAVVPKEFTGALVQVNDSRQALSALATRFYGQPASKMFCVGVTGTNGKTSVAYMIETVLNHFGWPTGVMGTVDHHLGEHKWPAGLTTPDPLVLQKRLWEFESLGAKSVSFEVSSHALLQKRVDSIPFDVLVFTNLTRDHLDYHGDMESYFSAKERLFRTLPLLHPEKSATAVINVDDAYGRQIQVAGGVKVWTYGQSGADFSYRISHEDFNGTEFDVSTPRGNHRLRLPVPGRHNVYNAVGAIAVGLAAGASLENVCEALSKFKGVPGRLQSVANDKGVHVFVDYAHTDDALRSMLNSLHEIRLRMGGRAKIITVFGCGGDRDKGKRPLMAKAAIAGSDVVFMTSDNPRTEDPEGIIADGVRAVPEHLLDSSFFCEVDRKTAISRALQMANTGDVVVIAGKGHEDYQIIGDEKRPFSDVEVAKELLT